MDIPVASETIPCINHCDGAPRRQAHRLRSLEPQAWPTGILTSCQSPHAFLRTHSSGMLENSGSAKFSTRYQALVFFSALCTVPQSKHWFPGISSASFSLRQGACSRVSCLAAGRPEHAGAPRDLNTAVGTRTRLMVSLGSFVSAKVESIGTGSPDYIFLARLFTWSPCRSSDLVVIVRCHAKALCRTQGWVCGHHKHSVDRADKATRPTQSWGADYLHCDIHSCSRPRSTLGPSFLEAWPWRNRSCQLSRAGSSSQCVTRNR